MSQQTESTTQRSSSAGVHTGHPTPMTYLKVAITLLVITAAEVAIFYANWLGYGIIPVLAILSIAKFALVVMFYMHLRYDSRLFSGMFVAGLGVAAAVTISLMALFRLFT